jgi:adenylylsulfate kinase-like enzyme
VCRALLLTGVAAVGKSTVADAGGHVLTTAGHVTAVVDTGMHAQFRPPPAPTGPDCQEFNSLRIMVAI